ncbi:MAG TPA: sulfotransferase, partial [Acidimicrobiales bacterium]|nr:sulfotransferase [Acidimicrobiales bacterium]
FKSQLFEGSARIPGYHDWLFACDMEPAYRYHERVLKLLQWRCPPTRWWLKTPSHMHAVDAFDRVYPDARFVMTHRDIASVIPSVCAVMFTLSRTLTDEPDPRYWGRHNTELWDVALHRTMAFRDGGAEPRFFDIGFADMQAAPIDAVRRLYEWLGEELTPVAEGRMAEWWDANSRERHGAHRYSPEDYGLDVDALRARFRFYTERFDVPTDRR